MTSRSTRHLKLEFRRPEEIPLSFPVFSSLPSLSMISLRPIPSIPNLNFESSANLRAFSSPQEVFAPRLVTYHVFFPSLGPRLTLSDFPKIFFLHLTIPSAKICGLSLPITLSFILAFPWLKLFSTPFLLVYVPKIIRLDSLGVGCHCGKRI